MYTSYSGLVYIRAKVLITLLVNAVNRNYTTVIPGQNDSDGPRKRRTACASARALSTHGRDVHQHGLEGRKGRLTEVAVARVVAPVERVEECGVRDGEHRAHEDEDEDKDPAHPGKRDEHRQDAALPELVAPEEVAPECLRGERAR